MPVKGPFRKRQRYDILTLEAMALPNTAPEPRTVGDHLRGMAPPCCPNLHASFEPVPRPIAALASRSPFCACIRSSAHPSITHHGVVTPSAQLRVLIIHHIRNAFALPQEAASAWRPPPSLCHVASQALLLQQAVNRETARAARNVLVGNMKNAMPAPMSSGSNPWPMASRLAVCPRHHHLVLCHTDRGASSLGPCPTRLDH